MRREADGRFMLEGHPLKEIRWVGGAGRARGAGVGAGLLRLSRPRRGLGCCARPQPAATRAVQPLLHACSLCSPHAAPDPHPHTPRHLPHTHRTPPPGRPQLERVLHFRPLPGGVGYLPAWRSAWPLSGAEETYLAALLAHRERKMREGAAYDELVPLPPGACRGPAGGAEPWGPPCCRSRQAACRRTAAAWLCSDCLLTPTQSSRPTNCPAGCVLPARFHPMGPGGVPLPPPCITRSGRPQNVRCLEGPRRRRGCTKEGSGRMAARLAAADAPS